MALDAPDVKVMATPEKVDIRLAVPLEFITIEQTSGCLVSRAKKTLRSRHLKSRTKIIRTAWAKVNHSFLRYIFRSR